MICYQNVTLRLIVLDKGTKKNTEIVKQKRVKCVYNKF